MTTINEGSLPNMVQAGTKLLIWFGAVAKRCPDNSVPECRSLYPVSIGASHTVQYATVNIHRDS